MIDWAEERSKFPALAEGVYLMTSAVGPLSKQVFQSYQSHYERMLQTGDIDYMANVDMLEITRTQFAEYLNASSPEDIGFCPNSSHGMNLIAMMLAKAGKLGEVLCPRDEFPASTLPWIHQGFELRFVDHPSDLFDAVNDKTVAVVCSQVQFGTGYRTDVKRLGQFLKEKSIEFIINATQAVGVFPTDVRKASATALVGSCHKWLCAGYGASVLYLSKEFRSRAQWPMVGWLSVEGIELRQNDTVKIKEAASAVETGVPAFSVIGAVGKALSEVKRIGIDHIAQRVHELSELLYQRLTDAGFEVLSDRDSQDSFENSVNSGTLLVREANAESLVESLIARKVYVSARGGGLRVSIHYYNNETDIDRLIEALKELRNR